MVFCPQKGFNMLCERAPGSRPAAARDPVQELWMMVASGSPLQL